ncbi:MAG: HAD family hydrolase, partial [Kineosporiaceae bacterium]
MSLWRRYDAMVFDVDAVIGPTTALHAAAWARVFDEFAVALARDEGQRFEPFDVGTDFRYVEGRAGCDAVAAFLASRGLDLPPGHPDDPPEAQTCWGLGNRKRVYFAEAVTEHRIEVFPDAVALIQVLAHAGKRLALICADESCDALLARVGLLDHFPVRVTDDAAARWGLAGKPAPDTLLKAADLLGVLAADAIVVEDSVAGVRAGQAGGFGLVVGVDRHDAPDGLSMSGADVVVRDLRELITMDEPAPVRARRRRRPPW